MLSNSESKGGSLKDVHKEYANYVLRKWDLKEHYCDLSFMECKLTLISCTKAIVNASLFFRKNLL